MRPGFDLNRVLLVALATWGLVACESDEAKLSAHMERGTAYVEAEQWPEAIIEIRGMWVGH